MSGVRDAAAALISVAPEATVLTVLKLLVDAVTPPPARTLEAPAPPAARPSPPRRAPTATTRPAAAAAAADPAWEELRRQVKTAMAERDVGCAGVAAAIGRSEIAVRISLGSRKPPRPIVQTRLQEWLQVAPAVAAATVPFPRAGTEHRGNGSGPASSFSSAA
jgi:hypothetical protein